MYMHAMVITLQKSLACCSVFKNRTEQCCAAHIAEVVKNDEQHCYTPCSLNNIVECC